MEVQTKVKTNVETNVEKKVKGNNWVKDVYTQPDVKPKPSDIDTLVAELISLDEFEDNIIDLVEEEVSVRRRTTIYFGNVTHKIKVKNKNFYRVEIPIDKKVYTHYFSSNQIRRISAKSLNFKTVTPGNIELD